MRPKKSIVCLLSDNNDGGELDQLRTCVIPLANFDFEANKVVMQESSRALHDAAKTRQQAILEGKIDITEADTKTVDAKLMNILSKVIVPFEKLAPFFQITTINLPNNLTFVCLTKPEKRTVFHILSENIILEWYLCHVMNDGVRSKEIYGTVLVYSTNKSTHLKPDDFREEIRRVVYQNPSFNLAAEKKAVKQQLSGEMELNRDFLEQKLKVCSVCGKIPEEGTKFKLCSVCRQVCYCSVACQKLNWPAHKPTHTSMGWEERESLELFRDNYYPTKMMAKSMALGVYEDTCKELGLFKYNPANQIK